MRIAYHGFFAKNHSWSVVAQNFVRSLKLEGHQVDVFSTNGTDNLPIDLAENIIGHVDDNKQLHGRKLQDNYDSCLSYTAMKNAGKYLSHSQGKRNLIWCYEFAGKNALPPGFSKYHAFADNILAPSSFARDVFVDSGVPADKITIVPHGVNKAEIDSANPFPLKTCKKVRFLINLGQVHARKNLEGALAMWGKAFKKNDDVCLVIKVQDRKPQFTFELNFSRILSAFKAEYKDHAEIEVIRSFIPNIYSLYKSVDFTFSPSHTEGFGMVPLEGMSCGVYPIVSNYGGFLDFVHGDNGLLIDGDNNWNVPSTHLYYQQRHGLRAFNPSIDAGVACLKEAYENHEKLKAEAQKAAAGIIQSYNWNEILRGVIV